MPTSETELRFLVPAAAQAALRAELLRGSATRLPPAEAEPAPADLRWHADTRRTQRRIRTRGAVVDLAFDDGRLVAPAATLRMRALAVRLAAGDPAAMFALAERWQRRFGLLLDPRTPAERGERLADGLPAAPVRKAARPAYHDDADAPAAFGAVLDECLAQILHNTIGLLDGDAALRVEHVHQLRVGIRRLRSALRCFQGWVPAAPAVRVDALKQLFTTLGAARDADVLDSGVATALAQAGAPAIQAPHAADGPDPVAVLRSGAVQQALLGWLAWRSEAATPASPSDPAAPDAAPPPLARRAASRLRRWHRRIAADAQQFAQLDEAAVHALRKRIKRQRYALEFFAPLLRRKPLQHYLAALADVQERMGALNDLFVARDAYTQVLPQDPAAWFALGWLAARIAEAREATQPALRRLARLDPPGD